MRTVLICAVLAGIGIATTYRLYPRFDSMGAYPSQVSRGEAIERARVLASHYGRDVKGWAVNVRVDRFQRTYEYLRTAPNHPLARAPQPYSYRVLFDRGPLRVEVEVLRDGRYGIYRFRDGRRPDFTGPAPTDAQEKLVLTDFTGDPGGGSYKKTGSVATGTMGHATTWEWRDEAAPDVIQQLEMATAHDGVRTVRLRADISASFTERWVAAAGRTALRFSLLPVLLTIGITLTCALLFPGLARGRIRLRQALRLMAALLAVTLVGFVACGSFDRVRFDSSLSNEPLPESLFRALTRELPAIALWAAMWAVGRWLMRSVSLDRWRTFDALLEGQWWRRQVGHSVACGLLLGAALTAVPAVLCTANLFPRSDAQTVAPQWLAASMPTLLPLSFQLPWDLSGIFFLLVPLTLAPAFRRWAPVALRCVLLAVLAILLVGLTRSLVNDDAAGNLTTGALLAVSFFGIYWKFDLVAVMVADLGFWATQVSVYFLHQQSDALRSSGLSTGLLYGGVALAGVAALLFARDLEEAPDETVVEIAAQREVFETEFAMARKAQQRLLPAIPARIDGFSLAASCHPARDVGGDLYDFFRYPDGTYGLCVADVSGKGVPAALYMTMTKGILAAASRDEANLLGLAAALNSQLHAAGRKKTFVTMALGRLDAEARTLEYLRAGHNSILWRSARGGRCEYLKPKGVGLGLTSNRLFERSIAMESLRFEDGDVAVFYSDGITEAMNASRELYGEDRLQAVVDRHAGLDAAGLEQEILREVREFMDGEPPHDDMTLLILRA
jgi:serine phosphatase RsbU (regulator of sigma subunit)